MNLWNACTRRLPGRYPSFLLCDGGSPLPSGNIIIQLINPGSLIVYRFYIFLYHFQQSWIRLDFSWSRTRDSIIGYRGWFDQIWNRTYLQPKIFCLFNMMFGNDRETLLLFGIKFIHLTYYEDAARVTCWRSDGWYRRWIFITLWIMFRPPKLSAPSEFRRQDEENEENMSAPVVLVRTQVWTWARTRMRTTYQQHHRIFPNGFFSKSVVRTIFCSHSWLYHATIFIRWRSRWRFRITGGIPQYRVLSIMPCLHVPECDKDDTTYSDRNIVNRTGHVHLCWESLICTSYTSPQNSYHINPRSYGGSQLRDHNLRGSTRGEAFVSLLFSFATYKKDIWIKGCGKSVRYGLVVGDFDEGPLRHRSKSTQTDIPTAMCHKYGPLSWDHMAADCWFANRGSHTSEARTEVWVPDPTWGQTWAEQQQ